MTDLDKVTQEWAAMMAAGTLEGYTDPDNEVDGQVRISWLIGMTEHPSKPNVYVGRIGIKMPPMYGTVEKEFRIAIKVVDA